MPSEQLIYFFMQKAVQGLSTGATLEEVKAVLGEADDLALLGGKRKNLILKYGQVEFYFHNSICDMIQFTFYNPALKPVYEEEVLRLLSSNKIEYTLLPEFTTEDQIAYLTANQIHIILDRAEKEVKKVYLIDKLLSF